MLLRIPSTDQRSDIGTFDRSRTGLGQRCRRRQRLRAFPSATWISSRSSSFVHPALVISNFKTQGLPLSRTEVAFAKLVHYQSPVYQTPVHLVFDSVGHYCNRHRTVRPRRLGPQGSWGTVPFDDTSALLQQHSRNKGPFMDVVIPGFTLGGGYLIQQASSTIHTALENRVPVLATRAMVKAYPHIAGISSILRPASLSEMEAIGLLRGAKISSENPDVDFTELGSHASNGSNSCVGLLEFCKDVTTRVEEESDGVG